MLPDHQSACAASLPAWLLIAALHDLSVRTTAAARHARQCTTQRASSPARHQAARIMSCLAQQCLPLPGCCQIHRAWPPHRAVRALPAAAPHSRTRTNAGRSARHTPPALRARDRRIAIRLECPLQGTALISTLKKWRSISRSARRHSSACPAAPQQQCSSPRGPPAPPPPASSPAGLVRSMAACSAVPAPAQARFILKHVARKPGVDRAMRSEQPPESSRPGHGCRAAAG